MTAIHTSLKKVGRSCWDYMTSIHMSFERAGFVGGGGGGVEVGTGSPGLRRSRWFLRDKGTGSRGEPKSWSPWVRSFLGLGLGV